MRPRRLDLKPFAPGNRDLTVTLIATVVTAAVGFVASVITNRILGPVGRGQLTSGQLIASLVTTFGWLGLPLAVPYFVAREPSKAREYFAASVLIAFVVSLPVSCIAWFSLRWFLPNRPSGAYSAAGVQLLTLPFLLLCSLGSATFRGKQKTLTWNALRMAPAIVSLLAISLAALFRPTAFGVSVSNLVLLAPVGLLASWLVSKQGIRQTPRRMLASARPLVVFALPGALQGVPQLLNYRVDQFLIGKFYDDRLTGLYATAAGWASLSSLLVASFSTLVVPALVSASTAEQSTVKRSLKRRGFVLALSSSAVLAAATPLVFERIYGNAFSSAVGPATGLAGASGLLGLTYVFSELARGSGRPKDSLYAELVGFAATFGVLLLVLRRFPLYGGVFASVAGYSGTLFTLIILEVRYERRIVALK
jgi:O-antigen/teichoic acid export membrane protein